MVPPKNGHTFTHTQRRVEPAAVAAATQESRSEREGNVGIIGTHLRKSVINRDPR